MHDGPELTATTCVVMTGHAFQVLVGRTGGQPTLRFLDAASLSVFLGDAGLAIEQQFGDWDRRPVGGAQPLLPAGSGRRGEHRPGLTDASPEIITVARPRRQRLQSGFS